MVAAELGIDALHSRSGLGQRPRRGFARWQEQRRQWHSRTGRYRRPGAGHRARPGAAGRLPHGGGDRGDNVHVALEVREPVGMVPADAADAEWRTVVDVVERDGRRDFRGPAVHGKAGERFLYLTWGTVDGPVFTMFRRAKLMLDEAPREVDEDRALVATVSLTDEKGQPRCARVRAPAIAWTIE